MSQAVVIEDILDNTYSKTNLVEQKLYSILNQIETADNKLKANLENQIVSFGKSAVDILVKTLMEKQGVTRGIAAMSLIRIGYDSILPLRKAAMANSEFSWIANYLISEIECCDGVA